MNWQAILCGIFASMRIGGVLMKFATFFYKVHAIELARRSSGSVFKFVPQGSGGLTVSGDVLKLTVGESVAFKSNTYLDCNDKIYIGDYCHFGGGLSILTTIHRYNSDWVPYGLDDLHLPVTLGDCVWVGRSVTILPGVSIGAGAIIGAGAVVTTSVPVGEIWAGCPAKKIGKRDMESFDNNVANSRLR